MAIAVVAAEIARRSQITGTHIPFVLDKNEKKTIDALKKAWAKVTNRSIVKGFSVGDKGGYLIYTREGKEDVNHSVTLYRYPLNNLLEFDLYDGPYGDNFMFAYYFELELQEETSKVATNEAGHIDK